MIKKVIIPAAGLGTRFLPLSKVVPKELWPLTDKPVVQYIVEEARDSGIKEIIFVVSPKRKFVLDYFKRAPKIEELLKQRKRDELLAELKKLGGLCEDVSFSHVVQKEPLGDGHAVLQAYKAVGNEPCGVMWADDVVESETPCFAQLCQVFKTCQKPIIALYRLPEEKLSAYGVVGVEKIANRLYKIRKIVEKPKPGQTPLDIVSGGTGLAVVGKYILTPEVFDYLKGAKPSLERGEVILAEVLSQMLKDGKIIYGYEFRGEWLECGNKLDWLKSNFYLSLKHPQFGSELRTILNK